MEAVGETPVVELDVDAPARVLGKVEWCNAPCVPYAGSIKARIAVAMIAGAEWRGKLTDETVIEPSSGNTARALARVCAARGYEFEAVMPADAAPGKCEGVRAAGGTIHEVPAGASYGAKLERAEELLSSHPDRYYRPNQYANPDNPAAHAMTTGPELARLDPDVVLVGVGTGGTATGLGRAFADRETRVFGFLPAEVDHDIGGLRYVPGVDGETGAYDPSLLDDRHEVATADAKAAARRLADRHAAADPGLVDAGRHDPSVVRERLRVDGAFRIGVSSGAAVHLVERLADAGELDDCDTVAVLLCDRGDVYPGVWK